MREPEDTIPTQSDDLHGVWSGDPEPEPAELQPDPDWIRGKCPSCGAPVVSNAYYTGGKGYLIFWECWNALGPEEERTCDYRRVL